MTQAQAGAMVQVARFVTTTPANFILSGPLLQPISQHVAAGGIACSRGVGQVSFYFTFVRASKRFLTRVRPASSIALQL
jgi:hypothetical protein